MVVASGTSQRHVASLAEKVQENLKKAGYKSRLCKIRVELNLSTNHLLPRSVERLSMNRNVEQRIGQQRVLG